MEFLATITQFTFQMVATLFNWMMSSWVTAAFPVACVVAFVVNLVITSASGSDEDK